MTACNGSNCTKTVGKRTVTVHGPDCDITKETQRTGVPPRPEDMGPPPTPPTPPQSS